MTSTELIENFALMDRCEDLMELGKVLFARSLEDEAEVIENGHFMDSEGEIHRLGTHPEVQKIL